MRVNIWKLVVKEVKITKSYPGYEYVYFKDEEDANNYFTELYGVDWRNEPWARFFLRRSEEAEINKERRRNNYIPLEENNGKITNYATRDPNNYEYMVKYCLQNGNTNTDSILQELRLRGYKANPKKVKTLIRKFYSTSRTNNPNKHVIIDLINYYSSRNLSLRKIADALRKDNNIHVSHEYIREILNE